jgi:hypothetical protein
MKAISAIFGSNAFIIELIEGISEKKNDLLRVVNDPSKFDKPDILLNVKGTILNNSYMNKDPIIKANGMFLVYWLPVSNISVIFMLSIIITKRKRTVIAPQYTIIYEIPMKPIPNSNKYPAALQKAAIKKITAITGFLEVITKILEKIVPKANISMNIFFIFVFI